MNFGKCVGPLGLLVILCLVFCRLTQADLLVLNNGDRITGVIKRIWDREISIEPEYSDEFNVDISVVDYIESDRVFEIDFGDGRSMLASFAGADADGNQIFESADESRSVPLAALFELDEPEKPFEWESNVEFAADVKRGNTDTSNTKLRADTMVKFNDHRHIGELTFFREELANVTTKDQELFRYSYNWIFRDPVFFSANLSFERDPIVELDSRVIISAGLGRDIWLTPRRALSVNLGAGYQTEEISSSATDSAVLTWTLRYRQDFFSDDVELFHNHTITSNVSGRTNTSYRTSTGLSYEITDLLSANITLDFDYETHPADLAENEDLVLLFGFGAEF